MSTADDRYVDAFGVERTVPQATREAFTALLIDKSRSVESILEPTTVLKIDAPATISVTLPAQSWSIELAWEITYEDDTHAQGTVALRDATVMETFECANGKFDRRCIELPPLPLGYHRMTIDAGSFGVADATLIGVPPTSFVDMHTRTWGIAIQLYTLRSQRNWGIGDFTDLAAFVTLAAEAGAMYVGLNPLHAPHRENPNAASPYAPTSRRFLNWLYIDVERVVELIVPDLYTQFDEPAFAAHLCALRATSDVDYSAVARLKDQALRSCFSAAMLEPDPAFLRFIQSGGAALERFATFETLAERFGYDVSAWPAEYREPEHAAVAKFVESERTAITYAMFLQYHAAQQLDAAASLARTLGVALYRDLAVGVDLNGADVWIDPHAYVASVSVGAPPDLLNPDGQAWGLPPLNPNTLGRDGYRIIAELFRANMHAAGALRIDHVMSLARLFWSPRGGSAIDGTYVHYPFEDLLGILALESVRAACCVVGEDLGTVPIGFRERMAQAEILSYRILFFERESSGRFLPADHYPPLCLAATGTHDLAPFAAWLNGDDIELRARLGVGDPERKTQDHAGREADRALLLDTLRQSGDLTVATPTTVDVLLAAHRFLARSPARIVMMQIDDAIGETLPVNVPGTSDQYPNWRRKLHLDLTTIGTDDRFRALCAMLRLERPRSSPRAELSPTA